MAKAFEASRASDSTGVPAAQLEEYEGPAQFAIDVRLHCHHGDLESELGALELGALEFRIAELRYPSRLQARDRDEESKRCNDDGDRQNSSGGAAHFHRMVRTAISIAQPEGRLTSEGRDATILNEILRF